MRVCAAELICSTGVLSFQTFKPVFCMHNKLRLHAEILSWWVNDVIFSRYNSLRSNRSVLNVSNGEPWNPKLTVKTQSSKLCQLGVKRTRFQNMKEKRKWFFDHSTTWIFSLLQKQTLNVHFYLSTRPSETSWAGLESTSPWLPVGHAKPVHHQGYHAGKAAD